MKKLLYLIQNHFLSDQQQINIYFNGDVGRLTPLLNKKICEKIQLDIVKQINNYALFTLSQHSNITETTALYIVNNAKNKWYFFDLINNKNISSNIKNLANEKYLDLCWLEAGIMLNKAKIVKTYDLNNKENGFLIELDKKDRFTKSYLTCVYPGSFKGYHLHKIRKANYVCVRGKVNIILFTPEGKKEHILSQGDKLFIDINIPTGLFNPYDEESWIINFPDPYYDPELKDEQVDYTEKEAKKLFNHE